MAPLEADLRTFLIADTDVNAIVQGRIHPDQIPQGGAVPALVYQRVTTLRDYHLAGQSPLARPDIQISCWDDDPDGAWALAEKVRLALSGYRGAMGTTTCKASYVRNEIHDNEPETGRYRALLEVRIWHAEPLPA